jgi:hypothetical protein
MEEGGINLYAYVLNNTVNRVDPLGLVPWGTDATVGLGIGMGSSIIYCCDENGNRIKAKFNKFCIGLFASLSLTAGIIQGGAVAGSGCPDKYSGWFFEGGGGIGVVAAGGSLSPDGTVGFPNAGIGLGGGLYACNYALISKTVIGCCK